MKRNLIVLTISAILLLSGCVRVVTTDSKLYGKPETSKEVIAESSGRKEPVTVTTGETETVAETESVIETESETEREAQATEADENESQLSDSELSLMQKVLLNQAEFVDVESDTMMKTTDIEGYRVNQDTEFYCMDMDGNGKKEVCIVFQVKVYSVFYELDGVVYRAEYPYRGMIPLYTDGTMHGSSGAASGSRTRFTAFTQRGPVKEIVSGYDYSYATQSNYYYTKNYDNEISRAEYMAIENKCSSVEATQYKFSRKNIEQYVN